MSPHQDGPAYMKWLPGKTTATISRFEFMARSGKAFAIVQTGETRKYGNIILKKGVTPL